ncbi:MAG: hypothetical protein ACUZ77_11235, partial [Candidatus Brocadiales bacterium]
MKGQKNHRYSQNSACKLIKAILLIGCVVTFGGCAISNVGKVTFRKATPLAGFQERKNLQGDKIKDEMLPLQYKNYTLSKDGMFDVGDSISIHLRTAYIATFSEFPSFWRVLSFRRGRANLHKRLFNGEIAIVANAFEEATGKEIDYKEDNGRLVFYSDDVQKGQLLNMSNLPIYGPIKYNGAPVALRLSIIELDVITEQARAIMSVIASAGSTAYPPASPVLGVLNNLGQVLVTDEQNDPEFRYTMVLDPRGGFEDLNHTILEAANYVFVRTEKRTEEIPWKELVLNENEGTVHWNDKDNNYPLYTDHT